VRLGQRSERVAVTRLPGRSGRLLPPQPSRHLRAAGFRGTRTARFSLEGEMTIADRAVLVTGASRGIGQALLEEALRRAAKRVYAGTRQPLAHLEGRVTPLTLDVTNAAQTQAVVERVVAHAILHREPHRFARILKSLLLRNQPEKPSTEHRLRATSDLRRRATLTISARASRPSIRPALRRRQQAWRGRRSAVTAQASCGRAS
jgi:hypothetical protein